MPVRKAREHFLGEKGERHNCAQAVLRAFQEKFNVPEEVIASFRAHGGGRAPEGLCGALYAVIHLYPENAAELRRAFSEALGSEKCREIRAGKRFTCLQCVEKAAELLREVENK